jgi:hypothetical protein
MLDIKAIMSITDTIEARLLLKRHFCSRKLERGNNSKASKNDVSNGASNVCPKMARYPKQMIANSTKASLA